jgi:hypothetical protein
MGEVALREIPQALTRFGSVIWAFPGWSETRFVWVTPCEAAGWFGWCAGAALAGLAVTTAAEAAAAAMNAAPDSRFPIMVVLSFGRAGGRRRNKSGKSATIKCAEEIFD